MEVVQTILGISASLLSIAATILGIKNHKEIKCVKNLNVNSDISQKGDGNTAVSGSGNVVGSQRVQK